MTKLQRCILLSVAVFVVLAGLYVPFEYGDDNERYSAGYSWIFAPSDDEAVVNKSQVLVAWIGIILVGAILWLATMPSNRKSQLSVHRAGHKQSAVPDDVQTVRTRDALPPVTQGRIDDPSARGQSDTDQLSIPSAGWSQLKTRDKVRIYGVAFAIVFASAAGSLFLKEVRKADPPPTDDDLCQFAANAVMLEQLSSTDTTVDPLTTARDLFGPSAKRKWTVEQAELFGDNINLLRTFLGDNERARAAAQSWLDTSKGDTTSRRVQESHLRTLLFNHCKYS